MTAVELVRAWRELERNSVEIAARVTAWPTLTIKDTVAAMVSASAPGGRPRLLLHADLSEMSPADYAELLMWLTELLRPDNGPGPS